MVHVPRLFARARFHYQQIRQVSPHPEIHVPYMSSLLNRSSEEYQAEAADTLCDLIRDFPYLHPRSLACLWRFVLQASPQLPNSTRVRLLRILVSRARQRVVESDGNSEIGESSAPEVHVYEPDRLVTILTSAISATPRNGQETSLALEHWSSRFVESSFSLETEDAASVDRAWTKLTLLAMVNCSTTSVHAVTISLPPSNAPSLNWETICILAQLERLMDGRTGRIYLEGYSSVSQTDVHRVADSMWNRWSRVSSSAVSGFCIADSSILGSFLYIAGRTRNGALLDACRRHVENELEAMSNLTLRTRYACGLLGELFLACWACGHDIRSVFSRAVPIFANTHTQAAVLCDALERIISVNLSLAHDLYLEATHARIEIKEAVLFKLAIKLARNAVMDVALDYVRHLPSSGQRRAKVLEAVLLGFATHPRHSSFDSLHEFLHDAMMELLCSSPPADSRLSVEKAIVCMLRIGQTRLAVSVIEQARQVDEHFFHGSALQSTVRLLIRHRFFRLAASLVNDRIATTTDDFTFRQSVVAGLVRGRAHRLARNVSVKAIDSQRPPKLLHHAAQYQYHQPSMLSALKVQNVLRRSGGQNESMLLGLHLLVAAGRIRAARHYFDRVHAQLTPEMRTAMGNELIHACLMSRSRHHRHRMKAALLVLKQLSDNTNFVADRITLNILIKGLLRWVEELDSNAVRALFDRLILSGYPTGGLYAPQIAPFGTYPSAHSPVLKSLPKISSHIDFVKHVRPLYKMFIKALHLRGDLHGARRVIGVLKTVQAQDHDNEIRDS